MGVMYLGGAIGLCIWLLAIAAFVITGIILVDYKGKRLFRFRSENFNGKGKRFSTALNPGMICFAWCGFAIVSSSFIAEILYNYKKALERLLSLEA